MEETKNVENNEIEKIDNDQTAGVAGGRTGIFHKWNITKTFCDNCDKVIDGEKVIGVTLKDGRIFCDGCVTRYRNLLGADTFNKQYLSNNNDNTGNKTKK